MLFNQFLKNFKNMKSVVTMKGGKNQIERYIYIHAFQPYVRVEQKRRSVKGNGLFKSKFTRNYAHSNNSVGKRMHQLLTKSPNTNDVFVSINKNTLQLYYKADRNWTPFLKDVTAVQYQFTYNRLHESMQGSVSSTFQSQALVIGP